ncbi:MAG: hypothetical protein WDM77_01710 [Steroidobacteraceae bacterium]
MSIKISGFAVHRFVQQAIAVGAIALGLTVPVAHAAVTNSEAGTSLVVAPNGVVTNVPNDAELVALLRATLEKVDYGNKTGDYHTLYGELTPQVQKVVDLPKLSAALEGFRKLRVDMGPVTRTIPLYEHPPQVSPDGLLLLRGTFPTSPREIRFDFGFARIDDQWRIQALTVDTSGVPGSAAPASAGAVQPAPRQRFTRKPVDSPFLDPSTDPPTATKW